MFSRMQLLANTESISRRFGLIHDTNTSFSAVEEISGFEHSIHPIITNREPTIISEYQWGLIPPDWKKQPEAIWNHTISAKLEYLDKRYAWSKVSQNRCLIPATAYYEFHWNDPKGKSKTKYVIQNADNDIFALAGLYSVWKNPKENIIRTFTVCTTTANETMTFVHNKDVARNYHRMPVMLNKETEKEWLDNSIPCINFSFPHYQPRLTAAPADAKPGGQMQLFQ